MTTKQRNAFKQEIINSLLNLGFVPSPRSIGKYEKVQSDGAKYRYDLTGISVRYEKQIVIPGSLYAKEEKIWIKKWAAYYKDLALSEDKRVIILPEKGKML